MKQQHIDDLEEQLSEVSKQIEKKTGQLSLSECLGWRVQHKKFGYGEVQRATYRVPLRDYFRHTIVL